MVSGEGAINNIKQRTSRDTIVQVEDENHRPVAGAAVVFLLPSDGPGATFLNGSKTASLVTGSDGRVVMPRMTANQMSGPYQIRVTASYRGQQTTHNIGQQNVAAAGAAAGHFHFSGKVIGIIAGVAAAGAVAGAVAATRGGGAPSGTLTPSGAATVSGPR